MSRLFFHPATIFIITIISIIFSISLYKSAQQTTLSAQNLMALETAVNQTAVEVDQLQQHIVEAQKPFAQEQIIRNELLQRKEGEYLVQIANFDEYPLPEPEPIIPPTPWESWKQLLFNK